MTDAFTTDVELPAPPEEVFRHLTDPAAMIRWMGQHATLKPVPGGACSPSRPPRQAPASGWSTAAYSLARKSSTRRAGSTSSPGSLAPVPCDVAVLVRHVREHAPVSA